MSIRIMSTFLCSLATAGFIVSTVDATEWRPARDPKPLSSHVLEGLEWLVEHQLESGGWGQGEESVNMGGGVEIKDQASVADTCAALLSLIRAGHTPGGGSFSDSVSRGVDFLLTEIEKADEDSLSITSVQGTRVQSKLGPFIDTFLAAVVLPELEGEMADAAGEARLKAGLEKVLRKIEKNQREDGTWDDNGWAPALAQSMAAKGLNRADQRGFEVNEEILKSADGFAREQVMPGGGGGGGFGGGGSAGVALYAGASNLGALQEAIISNRKRAEELREVARTADTDEERDAARAQLDEIAAMESEFNEFQGRLVEKLDDADFLAGFGSNGGEEFLSYVNIGESLVIEGGAEWEDWDRQISANLNQIQNDDGSWTGHHCITGRTFCTATALLTLLVDRMPVAVEESDVDEIEDADDDVEDAGERDDNSTIIID